MLLTKEKGPALALEALPSHHRARPAFCSPSLRHRMEETQGTAQASTALCREIQPKLRDPTSRPRRGPLDSSTAVFYIMKSSVACSGRRCAIVIGQLDLATTDRESLSFAGLCVAKAKRAERSDPLIVLENISKTHDGERMLFRDLSLTVQAGDKISLVGRNGSGKSSLLRIIQGALLRPTATAHLFLICKAGGQLAAA